jgi:hypothetical protein
MALLLGCNVNMFQRLSDGVTAAEAIMFQFTPSVLVTVRVTPFCVSAQLPKTNVLLKYAPDMNGM